MNTEHISDALDQLDDGLLDEANAVRNGQKRRSGWPLWFGAVACLALVICAGARLLHAERGLPILPLSEEVGHPNGMGYEGYLAYDVSELVSGTPWRETDDFQSLPVYRNPVVYDTAGLPVENVNLDAMEARVLEVAGRLGVEVESQDPIILDGYSEPAEVTARGNGVEITADANLTVSIFFEPGVDLPGEYNFGYHAPYEDMKKVSDHLLGQYRTLLAMDDPKMEPTGGDYNIYGEQGYEITAYDGAGDGTRRLVNYSFHRATFSCDDEGKLWIIRLSGTDLSQKVGDYPVITLNEAKKLLEEGRYITSAPYELPGAEYVREVELRYLSGRREEYFMPYYRFLVELPQEAQENGLKSYGAYYVPAVEEAYLTGLPVWDGSFN